MLVVVASAIVACGGCGSGLAGPVAVRVGDASIDKAAVDHWAKTVGLGERAARSPNGSHGTARERALDFLIASNWLIEEASDRGITISDENVERRLEDRIEFMPNGRAEFTKKTASMGKTLADVKFEIKTELAAARLRALVSSSASPATQTDIANYYKRHEAQFRAPDLRVTDLVEGIVGTRAEVAALGKHIGTGRRFTEMAVHERVARETSNEEANRYNGKLVHTIFTAVPGKVAGPVWYNDAWVLVVVREVVPGSVEPLAKVTGQVTARLLSQRRRLALLDFVNAYRDRWTGRTDCAPGFIVQKCSQYHGPMVLEVNPLNVGTD